MFISEMNRDLPPAMQMAEICTYRRRNERLTDWEIERELVVAIYGLWWNNGNLKNNFFIIPKNSNAPHYINVLNKTMIQFIQNDGPEFSSMTMQGFTRRV